MAASVVAAPSPASHFSLLTFPTSHLLKIMTTHTQNLINDLNSLNATLPPGIRAVFVSGRVHYVVRSSKRGKKQSLGTFLDLEVAKAALVQYKLGGMVTLTAEQQQTIADKAAAQLAAQEAKKRLELVPLKTMLPSQFVAASTQPAQLTQTTQPQNIQAEISKAEAMNPSDDRLFVLLCAECDDNGPHILFDAVVSCGAANGAITVFPAHIVDRAKAKYFGIAPDSDADL